MVTSTVLVRTNMGPNYFPHEDDWKYWMVPRPKVLFELVPSSLTSLKIPNQMNTMHLWRCDSPAKIKLGIWSSQITQNSKGRSSSSTMRQTNYNLGRASLIAAWINTDARSSNDKITFFRILAIWSLLCTSNQSREANIAMHIKSIPWGQYL